MARRRMLWILGALATLIGLVVWMGWPGGAPALPALIEIKPVRFRLGLVPERDLYEQRKAYRALADYLQTHTQVTRGASTFDRAPVLQVELVTSSNYAGVLQDFASGDVDGAFLGSLVAVLAVDRCGAQVLAKSEDRSGQETYAGTIFVTAHSPVMSLADLRGKKLGAVRTTTAGSIFPQYAFMQAGMGREAQPEIVWSGTHDDVIEEVAAGRLDAGAVKDLRLDAYEAGHPGVKFRRLVTGPRVPDNAFVVRRNLPPDLRDALLAALLNLGKDPAVRQVLAGLGLNRFVPCELREYGALYDMIEALGPGWGQTGVAGAAPERPKWASTKAGG